jgi:hypothetical protein
MNQATLGLANKLLNKAQSTDFDAEAAALTERAYRLLAHALNDYDSQAPSAGPARRRERRNLRDRRSKSGPPSPSVPSRLPNPTAAHTRRAEWMDLPGSGQVDLMM